MTREGRSTDGTAVHAKDVRAAVRKLGLLADEVRVAGVAEKAVHGVAGLSDIFQTCCA